MGWVLARSNTVLRTRISTVPLDKPRRMRRFSTSRALIGKMMPICVQVLSKLRAVPIFPLEFVEPRKRHCCAFKYTGYMHL